MDTKEVVTPGSQEEPMTTESLAEKMARLTSDIEPGEQAEQPDAEESPGGDPDTGDTPDGDTTDEYAPEGEESDEEGEESDEAEQDEESEGEDDEKPDPKLSEYTQKRIAKLTARMRSAEERATAVDAELATLKARNEELEAQVSESFAEHAVSLGFAPQFLSKPELDVLKRDQELATQERFFMEHAVSGEPYEDPNSGEEYSPKQMAAWYHDVRDERAKISSKVHSIKSQRTKEMLDALQAGKSALTKKNGAPKPAARKAAKPPKVPAPTGAPNKPPITTPGKRGFDGKALAEGGYTRDALAKQLEHLVE